MKKLILVTGAHRSGTTWTGQIISSASNVRYIHEPFNLVLTHYNPPFENMFEYQNGINQSKNQIAINYIDSFYKINFDILYKRILNIKSIKDILKYLHDTSNRITHRTVIKDPIAIMSTEWLYHNYNCDVVITIRHPAAFIASLKVKDWQFDFNNYLKQEDLMNGYLMEYKDQIIEFSKTKQDIIKQGILLWNTIYSTVLKFKEKYSSEWYFVKHEDLSENPALEFEKMFNYLNLPLDTKVKKKIIETSTSTINSEHKRDSKSNTKTWKTRLTPEEISLIKKETQNVWKHFYAEKDWS